MAFTDQNDECRRKGCTRDFATMETRHALGCSAHRFTPAKPENGLKPCVHGVADGIFCRQCAQAFDRAALATGRSLAEIGMDPKMVAPKLDDVMPPHLRMDRKPVISTLGVDEAAIETAKKLAGRMGGEFVLHEKHVDWSEFNGTGYCDVHDLMKPCTSCADFVPRSAENVVVGNFAGLREFDDPARAQEMRDATERRVKEIEERREFPVERREREFWASERGQQFSRTFPELVAPVARDYQTRRASQDPLILVKPLDAEDGKDFLICVTLALVVGFVLGAWLF